MSLFFALILTRMTPTFQTATTWTGLPFPSAGNIRTLSGQTTASISITQHTSDDDNFENVATWKQESKLVVSNDEGELRAETQNGGLLNITVSPPAQYDRALIITNVVKTVVSAVCLALCTLSVVVFWLLRAENAANHFLLAINAAEAVTAGLAVMVEVTSLADSRHQDTLAFQWFTVASLFVSVSLKRCVYVTYLFTCVLCTLAVIFPMKPFHRDLRKSPKIVIAVLFLIIFSFHLYLIVEHKVEFEDGKYVLKKSDVYIEEKEKFLLWGNFGKSLFSYFPLTASLMLNGLLLGVLTTWRRASKVLHEGQRRQEEHLKVIKNVTIFLVMLVAR